QQRLGRVCRVWLHPGVERAIPIAATDRGGMQALPSPCRVSPAGIAALVALGASLPVDVTADGEDAHAAHPPRPLAPRPRPAPRPPGPLPPGGAPAAGARVAPPAGPGRGPPAPPPSRPAGATAAGLAEPRPARAGGRALRRRARLSGAGSGDAGGGRA